MTDKTVNTWSIIVGDNIRTHRRRLGITSKELAKRIDVAGIPCDGTKLSLIERYKPSKGCAHPPTVTVDLLVTVAQVLGVKVTELLAFSEDDDENGYDY